MILKKLFKTFVILGVTQAESSDEVYLAPLVKHSTINLQDLN